ncbi:MAG: hypothetical protein DI549_01740 [Ancylobacter novellus]|uniref:Uncharacterized protein n=1 Tax=Ancylobacter novellus TaxID=921 RepID=A0A2W5SRN4_ANCNO|nr:MAG: hypothetical protein DI549_01740 [Ancylobacter novellus]
MLPVMRCWSLRRVLVLLLAVLITAGMNLSMAHASDVTAKKVVTADVGVSAYDGCQGCPNGGDHGVNGAACAALCATPVLAVLPQEALALDLQRTVSFAGHSPLLHGMAMPPDPYPPRLI